MTKEEIEIKQPIAKYKIGQRVFFLYEERVKSDAIISIHLSICYIEYEIYIYFGVFKDIIKLYENKVFLNEADLLNSLRINPHQTP